jgi:hypothetical protein
MTVRERCNAIEECYEFMLGYAAKGVPAESGTGGQLRHHLSLAVTALTGIAGAYSDAVHHGGRDGSKFDAFIALLDRDSKDSLAAFEMVLSLPSISSQVIDNLNALIHLRALLTDLFLIDEILRPQRAASSTSPSGEAG